MWIIKSNKVYKDKKLVMEVNREQLTKKILKKVQAASYRAMKDAIIQIKIDIDGDENTDIWREQKVRMKAWRGIRDVYRRLIEGKIKCIERIIWVYRKNTMMNKKHTFDKWSKITFDKDMYNRLKIMDKITRLY